MSLVISNTLTRRKAPFVPLQPKTVLIYGCGVTVYDYCHLGHARSYIGWDTVRRYLSWRGYQVRYVQNFTDIDDKIINRSREEGLPWQEITTKYIDAYQTDMARLNILRADSYPKATEFIPEIIDLIKALIERDVAYVVSGDVYYAVERFPDYGKLSGRQLDQMEAGASGRLDRETETKKRHPLDFALWKTAKPDEPAWDSPWGPGRPGWHIECSAMVRSCLGERIDIHMGGEDLVFPHHENEIAQSEAIFTPPLAAVWMHNGFVKIRGDKMSKSLKNFTTIRALLEIYDPMVVRLFVLQAHYSKPIDFTEEAMTAAQNGWLTLQEGLLFGWESGKTLGWSLEVGDRQNLLAPAVEQFQAAMDDDFNTPSALVGLFELAKDLRKAHNLLVHQGEIETDSDLLERQWQTLVVLAQVLGLEALVQPEALTNAGLTDAEVEAQIAQRQAARKAKNWAESDRIRDDLQAQGVTLIDQPGGVTRWHRN